MRTIILLIVYLILLIPLMIFMFFCYIARVTNPIIKIGKYAMSLSRFILGIKVEVQGLDHVDKHSPYIFMANHASFIDGPLLFMLIPQFSRVILKKQIFRIPVVGLGMKQIGFIPVDRKGRQGGRKAIERASSLIKKRGYSFLIFPEGTRTLDGKLQEFRRGGFFLALESKAPIVPVALKGSYQIMPKGTFFIKGGRVKVKFLPPVSLDGYNEKNINQLKENVRGMIKNQLEKER